jgi:CBS domain containing-hemolysin-like protein
VNLGSDASLIAGLVVMFVAAVVLGAAEAALIRVPRARVAVAAEQGDRAAARLLRLIDRLPLALNTILLVVLLAQIGAATVVGVLAGRHLGGLGVTVVSILLTLVLFIYAEAIPKTVAVRHPLTVARFVMPLVAGLVRLLRPVTRLLVAFADLQAPGRGVAGRLGVTEEELRFLAGEAATAGEIDPSDRDLIERGFDFGDLTVDQILVPRPDIVSVERRTPVGEALDIAVTAGHRRIPVHKGDIDAVVGVVRLRDLAAAVADDPERVVDELTVPVLTVPESKRVVELLREMQSAALHLAMVVDEHGGIAGLVTIEDAVEELVGKVADEGEPRRPLHRRIGPGRWEVDARLDVDDFESLLGEELDRGPWRTVGGLLLHLTGKVPQRGDVLHVGGYTIRVSEATPRRLKKVVVERTAG